MWTKFTLRLKDKQFLKRLIVGVPPVTLSLLFFLYQENVRKSFSGLLYVFIGGFLLYLIMLSCITLLTRRFLIPVYWSIPMSLLLTYLGYRYNIGGYMEPFDGLLVFAYLFFLFMAYVAVFVIYIIYRIVKHFRS